MSYFLGFKNAGLVPLMVVSSKRSTVGAFVLPLRYGLEQKKMTARVNCVVSELFPLRGEKHITGKLCP